jgi:protein tyrosine phosphatase (PTP) superfamily phosphohydrolase (DUF442 family)
MMGSLRAALAASVLFALPLLGIDVSRKQAVESVLSSDIPMLLCVTDEVATGGQPRDSAWPKLAKLGYKTVLTLRTPQEINLERQKGAVEAAGLRFVNIPVGNPTDAQLDQFLSVVRDNGNNPILIHCTGALRVGAFWMVHRVLDDGFNVEKALEEARRIGLRGRGWEEWAVQTIATRKGARKPA